MICYHREYFECIIPKNNRYAFYELIAGRDLFGFIVVRRWGRIGTRGQPLKQQRFTDKTAMMQEFDRVYKERIKHEYKQTCTKTRYAPLISPKRRVLCCGEQLGSVSQKTGQIRRKRGEVAV